MGQLDAGGAAAQPTNYIYDGLGNLKTVTQGVQTRTFQYDFIIEIKERAEPGIGNDKLFV